MEEFSLRNKFTDFLTLILNYSLTSHIQGDSRGQANILGSNSTSHCTKYSSYEHVSNCEWLLRQSGLNVQLQSIVNGYKEREIICYYFMSILK